MIYSELRSNSADVIGSQYLRIGCLVPFGLHSPTFFGKMKNPQNVATLFYV